MSTRVNPGSKAYHQGLLEGDLLKMVNGFITDGLSQMDVQNIIKETGTHLTLEVERNPVVQNDVEKTYTARTTITFNGSPNYAKANRATARCLRLFSWLLLLSLPRKNHVFPDPEIPHPCIPDKDLGGWGSEKDLRQKSIPEETAVLMRG
ncbi:PDZ domain-containing protein [Caerostris extrusa]|uniref:PDZ domain-containing protein n=1 Tax=Caerostris extrusa TaxID=172846 RepID=A0AAV4XIA2_CAEEX|nr:PDZ domain-containing protein [Caerostris extrusa]